MPSSSSTEYEQKFVRSQYILSYIDQHLVDNRFSIGDTVCLADISVYVYTHLAEEGGLQLANYPNLKAWFERIEGLEGFVQMYKRATFNSKSPFYIFQTLSIRTKTNSGSSI